MTFLRYRTNNILQRVEKDKEDKLHATKIRQKIKANDMLVLTAISNKSFWYGKENVRVCLYRL
jgi:hypothetical protein